MNFRALNSFLHCRLPLIFVLGVTALKDIFEDRRRYLSDKRVNNYTCRVYKSNLGRYVKTLWKDVKVGDMVHLSVNEMIPADIIVLRSSDEHGLCYIGKKFEFSRAIYKSVTSLENSMLCKSLNFRAKSITQPEKSNCIEKFSFSRTI